MAILARLAFILWALTALSSPARADDITAAGRSVVRVVVVAFEDGEIVDFSHGSGFAVSPNRVVTNAHVVAIARDYPEDVVVGVVPSEGDQSYRARVLAMDPSRDLALIEMTEGTLPPIPLYMGPLTDGADVIALGYPANVDLATAQSASDYIRPLTPTRSEGIFSNERRIAGVSALLHTANVARGNSGGPLVDPCGRVLGVNSFLTRGADGDAPFGFAISNRELASFLRASKQPFSAISSACVSMTDQLREEKDRREREEAERTRRAEQARLTAQRQAEAKAMAANEDARENQVAIALLLGLLGTLSVGAAGLFYLKDRRRPAAFAGGIGLLLIAGAGVAFFTRPARVDGSAEPKTAEAPSQPARTSIGPNICRFVEDRSRVTVSSVEDVDLRWTADGCVNGRTQYANHGEMWDRILVPRDEATISVAEFRPGAGEYEVTRYLMSAADMARARELRGEELKTCTTDSEALAIFADRQAMIRSTLPKIPNERLVYKCEPGEMPKG